jgi:hypothetical protein
MDNYYLLFVSLLDYYKTNNLTNISYTRTHTYIHHFKVLFLLHFFKSVDNYYLLFVSLLDYYKTNNLTNIISYTRTHTYIYHFKVLFLLHFFKSVQHHFKVLFLLHIFKSVPNTLLNSLSIDRSAKIYRIVLFKYK